MKKRLTTSEVAARLGVGKSTVNLWCNQGRFPNAEHVEEARGPVWYIPDSDLVGYVKPTKGRPSKSEANGTGGKKGVMPATPKFGSIELQTRTTRKLDPKVRRTAEGEMGGRKKGGNS